MARKGKQPASTQPAPVVAAINEVQPAAVAPPVVVAKTYRVELPPNPPMAVQAATSEEAWRIYAAMMGILVTEHKPRVREV